jgi:hypothetical protein
VTSRPIENFRIGSSQKRFGELEFAGGLEMNASSRHFGGCRRIHVFDDQSRVLGVADTGFWYAARIRRDANRRARRDRRCLHAGDDGIRRRQVGTDAEGMTVSGDTAFVSFERDHRVAEFGLGNGGFPVLQRQYAPPVPLYELRDNRGFETVTVAPPGLPYAGALVGVSEKSLDKNLDIMAFVRHEDGRSFEFSVKRVGEFDITDGKFLPDGDLILLERRFNMSDGIAMRLRRIRGADIEKGATVDGDILLEADLLYQIDNMEGLSITIDPDGTPRLTLVSDDNHSILQRNLLLEFRLVGKDGAPS